MAKNLIVLGIGGKAPGMPPKFGGAKKSPSASPFGDGPSPAEQDADEYSPAPSRSAEPSIAPKSLPPSFGGSHESTETPESGDHDLKPGAQFSAEVAHYHGAEQRCDACNAWQGGECAIWTNATDPGGWCSVFPADYMAHESAEGASEIGEESTESGEVAA